MVRDSGADAAALVVDCDKPVVINIQGGHNVVSILLCKSNRQCEQWPVTAFWLCTALLSSPGYVVTTMVGPVLPVFTYDSQDTEVTNWTHDVFATLNQRL